MQISSTQQNITLQEKPQEEINGFTYQGSVVGGRSGSDNYI